MIEKTQSYSANGKIFASLKEAQTEEVKSTLASHGNLFNTPDGIGVLSEAIIANADKLVDILTTKGSSKPKARAINGGTKKRTPRVQLPNLPTAA